MTRQTKQAPEDGGPSGPETSLGTESYAGKTVVVCVGNRYLGDDGIGIHVADELRRRDLGEDIVVDACQTADLSLLWQYSGALKVVVVDCLKSGAPPGTVSRYAITPNREDITSVPGLHNLQLSDMFDIATQARLLTCPVTVIGVEPKNCEVGEDLSDELENAIPSVLREVAEELARPNSRV